MIPILDTHQHLWDLSLFRLPWLEGASSIKKNHVMQDYFEATEGLNVVKTIYMEVAVADDQISQEAEYVIDLCGQDDNPMVGAVIGGRPNSPDFPAYVKRFAQSPYIKGVRQVLHVSDTPEGYSLQSEFVRGVQLLGEQGLRFDICVPSTNLLDGAKLAELCPDTRMVLDHCGNANVQVKEREQWKRDIAEVAKHDNVICKISGIIASADPNNWSADDLAPIILHCAEVFGKERIIFASDWPVCTLGAPLKQWVGALKDVVHSWSEADQKRLFYDNAHAFYELSDE